MEIEDDGPPGVPEWVVTYGDMMSLLLTFFIMLVSMSELKDEGKNRAALNAITERFAPMHGDAGVPGQSFSENSMLQHNDSQGNRSRMGLEQHNRDSSGPGGESSAVERINHGEIVTIGGTVTFEQFESQLEESERQLLNRLVDTLKQRPNRIVVRGHAFAEPLRGYARWRVDLLKEAKNDPQVARQIPQIESPHDLSFARAHSVAKYLMQHGIPSQRIQVSAAGDSEPRILTRNLEDRRRNRRVDVFTIDSYVSPPDAEGGSAVNG
ncbi:MAG: OmpA/MotB family protein [Planctomycetota bacterium]